MKGNVVGRVGLPQWFKDQQDSERRKFHADQVARMAAFNEWQRQERNEYYERLRGTTSSRLLPIGGATPKAREREERRTEIAESFLNSSGTLALTGERFGISRERVRQCVEWYDPTGNLRLKRERRIETEKLIAILEERAKTAQPCKVCGSWILRHPHYETCSPDCAKAWTLGRYRLSPDERQKHRLRMARTYLNNPEKYKQAHLDWAERMLSDEPPEPNRTYFYPESQITQALEKVGKV